MPKGNVMFSACDAARMWVAAWNKGKNPHDYTITSHYKAWFLCDNEECGHYFQAFLYNMSKKGNCPYCVIPSKILCEDLSCDPCHNKSMASHPIASIWSPENPKSPRQVFLNTTRFKIAFDCRDCGHTFSSSPGHILKNMTQMVDGVEVERTNWCPYCADKKMCGVKSCLQCRALSFADHPKAQCWIKEKNSKRAWQCFAGTADKYWFLCDKKDCGHEFQQQLAGITCRDAWCPYCSGDSLCLSGCDVCFQKTFASHDRAHTWAVRNPKTARETLKGSQTIVDFDCDCGHTFKARPSDVSRVKHYCPYCSPNPKRLCDKDDCDRCFKTSFASFTDLTPFWAKEDNDKSPRELFPNSKYQATFICKLGHKFSARLHNIARGGWCTKCYLKGEQKFFEILSKYYDVKKGVRFDWCRNEKTGRILPFDFLIPSEKIIIELDGHQHFRQVMNWKDPEETRKLDIHKMYKAYNRGYCIIRITWEYARKPEKRWLPELLEHIRGMTITGGGWMGAYMCENNEYDVY